ncbi:4-hydroxybenzoate octaprenyltransferase [Pseudomonas sp. F1_0610]|uniref:4-hydroxybenzoate octaprenyltransferase n=1 Tax=Pseudomonas sp. F1_0610 TaxID=3114284 RepID=UPI0039C0499E
MYIKFLKSLNKLHPRAWDFIQLMRFDRPIGIYLLLWPTLWALWIASKGSPSLINVIIFCLGVALTRAAGCCINDYADRDFDGHVERTKERPLATGKLKPKEALMTGALLLILCFLLVLFTNITTILWSFGAVALAALYPFTKRYTFYPQVVLGAAYSWGIILAFTAETESVPAYAWLLYIANLLWTVAYDTYYAMADREHDLKIGVKSTAIVFGDADRIIIFSLQWLMLGCLVLAGSRFELGVYFYTGLLVAAVLFCYEFYRTRNKEPLVCFHMFLHNHWAGLAIFVGLVAHYGLAN